jgi:long-chain acyl-CoA synthetase
MSVKVEGRFDFVTYQQVWDRCVRIHGGLHRAGVAPKRWIITLGDGSGPIAVRFWCFVLGVQRAGCAVACLGGRRLDELLETLERCDPAMIAVESPKMEALAAQAAEELRKAGKPAPPVLRLWERAAEADASAPAPAAAGNDLDALMAAGEQAVAAREISTEGPGAAAPDDYCVLLLTSGSTGRRKAVGLTHSNFYHSYAPAVARVGVRLDDCLLQYMPAAHVLAHDLTYALMYAGARICFTSADARLINDIVPSGCTVVPGPPRLGMVIMNSAEYEIRRKGAVADRLYRFFQWASRRYHTWPAGLRRLWWPLHRLGNRMFYRHVRARLGKVRGVIFGSAPLPVEVQRWFYIVGIQAVNGYGLTEAPIAALSDMDEVRRLGSVGRPLEGVEWKFLDEAGKEADDAGKPLRRGNLLLRGPGVLREYYRDPEHTAEGFRDGWFITGDLARLDERGELTIEGRIKDIVVPVGGENLAPIPVENAIAGCPYVEQAVVVGDGCKAIGALIIPQFERLREWAAGNGIPAEVAADAAALVAHAHVRDLFTREVKARTAGIEALAAHGGAIARVELLTEPFTVENGLLTPDIRKIRRRAVYEQYSETIKKLCG